MCLYALDWGNLCKNVEMQDNVANCNICLPQLWICHCHRQTSIIIINIIIIWSVIAFYHKQYAKHLSIASIHVSPPSWTSLLPTPSPHPTTLEHWAELPVLYSSFLLALYFTHSGICILNLPSQFISSSPSPPVSTGPFSLCLYSWPANRHP